VPELPEVETTRRGLLPRLQGKRIERVVLRNRALRQPVPRALPSVLTGATLRDIQRRGKYLLFAFERGTLIVHLGMSGSLWLVDAGTPPGTHDHADLAFARDCVLRLRDPRRFGLMLWTTADPFRHPLIKNIGPEPLSAAWNGAYLHEQTRNRFAAIKILLMDSHIVAGVGNIYASEALFRAGIRPSTRGRRLKQAQCALLAAKVKETLLDAIAAGGSSLRDYVGSTGARGYFQLRLNVYDRAGEPCLACATPIKTLRHGQRATYYCPRCQR
jgi:formamidopyrimidine-DNA glycosylase